VYIEISKKNLSLQFIVHDEKIIQLIKTKELDLKNQLMNNGFKEVSTKYRTSKDRVSIIDLDTTNLNKYNRLDIRV